MKIEAEISDVIVDANNEKCLQPIIGKNKAVVKNMFMSMRHVILLL